MTYEELKQLAPGTLVWVEMNGVTQNVDPSQVSSLTVYDTAMIKRMHEAVFADKDTRFNQVVEFIEKLK